VRTVLHVTIHIDGGSRGNPGPAAAGVVITADDGTVLHEAGLFLGRATNNVAEYSGLLGGLKAAGKLGAREVDIVSDSELLVRQMNGQYRVKNAGLAPLFQEAQQLARAFARCTYRHVRREENVQADGLVNQALDRKKSVGDVAND
jgi:ribonuclease HI